MQKTKEENRTVKEKEKHCNYSPECGKKEKKRSIFVAYNIKRSTFAPEIITIQCGLKIQTFKKQRDVKVFGRRHKKGYYAPIH